MKRCEKCILPSTYPGISYNDQGICNYCTNHVSHTYRGEEELKRLLSGVSGNSGKYDCVLGISGGRDSSYALYYLVKVLGLRVLAWSADNGFVSDAAKRNMKEMVDRLGVDLIIEEHDYLKRLIRWNVKSWVKHPSPAMIPMVCSGCRLGMFRGLLNCAGKHNIPFVFLGAGGMLEVCRFKQAFIMETTLGRLFKRKKSLSLFFGLLNESLKNPSYFLSPRNTGTYMAEYFYYFHMKTMQKLFYPNQEIVYLFRYIPWDEKRILETITKELGWRKSEKSDSPWRFDCAVSFLKNYLLKKMVGFTEKDDQLSNMIREGMITRDEATGRMQRENAIDEKVIEDFLSDIGFEMERLKTTLNRL